ncbi:hypothetical protein ACLOJK_020896 [Asimina triloba]
MAFIDLPIFHVSPPKPSAYVEKIKQWIKSLYTNKDEFSIGSAEKIQIQSTGDPVWRQRQHSQNDVIVRVIGTDPPLDSHRQVVMSRQPWLLWLKEMKPLLRCVGGACGPRLAILMVDSFC